MDPVSTLKRDFRPPGSSIGARGATVNLGAGGPPRPQPQHRARVDESSVSIGRGHQASAARDHDYSQGVGRPGWPQSAGNLVKKQRTGYATSSVTDYVYRDGETTGYEDDGSDPPPPPTWNYNRPEKVRPPGFQPVVPHQAVNLQHTPSHTDPARSHPLSLALNAVNGVSNRAGLTPLGLKAKDRINIPSHSSATEEKAGEISCYAVMWRLPNTRKNKPYKDDAILVVVGSRGQLKDKETSSVIANGKVLSGDKLSDGTELTIGGKEIEIQNRIPAEAYLSGTIFSKNAAAVAPSTTSSKSFYGPRSSGATNTKFVPPSIRPVAYAPSKVGLPRPVPVQQFDENNTGALRDGAFPANNRFSTLSTSARTASATRGLAHEKPAKPVHNPELSGAIIMPRPDEEHQQRFNGKHKRPIVDVVIDPIIGQKLRPHQKEGVEFMYRCVMSMGREGHGCILADDMGLGKTLQSIALLWTLLKQTPYFGDTPVIKRAIIVCPVTLVTNWGKEFIKWVGRDRCGVFLATGKNDVRSFARNHRAYQILIIGYEKLRTAVDDLKGIVPPIGLMICDEGHRLKSAYAKTTKALQEIKCERRIILSGTPIQNDLSEFWAMADFVNPGLLDSYNTFKKVYEQPILKAREANCTEEQRELGQHRAEALKRVTDTYVLRRTADIIAGYLPPRSDYVVFVAPTALQASIYQHVLSSKDLRSILANGSSALGLIMLLRKACNSPGLIQRDVRAGKMGDTASSELAQELLALFPPSAKWTDINLSGKLLAVASLLRCIREDTREKVVLVSNFTTTLNILEQLCISLKYGYCRLDGNTRQQDRQIIVDNFNRSSQQAQFIFLLSSKSGGTGLNIIGASRLVLVDSDWNPSNDLQAMARIHRDGQKRPCVIYRIVITGSLDEKIYQRQIIKTSLAGSVMEGESSKGGSKDAFTRSELRDIFTLQSDTACQTHDLLECPCNPSTLPAEDPQSLIQNDDHSEDSEEDLPVIEVSQAFVKASQYNNTPVKSAKAQKKLAALKEWTHINCERDKEQTLDNIEDGILRETVSNALQEVNRAVARQRQIEDDEDDTIAFDEQAIRKRLYTGGEVTFVFHKNASNLSQTA